MSWDETVAAINQELAKELEANSNWLSKFEDIIDDLFGPIDKTFEEGGL